MFSSGRMLALATLAFGLALYVVNLQILGRIALEWFQEGPNQTFEVFPHAGYGLLLAPFMLGYAGAAERLGATARGSAAAGECQTARRPMKEAMRICLRRDHLRRTGRIALVVGTILTAINQGDVILGGDAVAVTWIKAGLNYCVPFVVANLGLLAGQR